MCRRMGCPKDSMFYSMLIKLMGIYPKLLFGEEA